MIKTTKTEVLLTRITPAKKMEIVNKVNNGPYKSQADLFNKSINLMLKDPTNLFAGISDHFNDEYVISSKKQYQQLKEAYEELRHACYLLTKLTDNYDQEKAPSEYKDVLRDYLLPRLYSTLQKYEDENSVPLTDRLTDQASEM